MTLRVYVVENDAIDIVAVIVAKNQDDAKKSFPEKGQHTVSLPTETPVPSEFNDKMKFLDCASPRIEFFTLCTQ